MSYTMYIKYRSRKRACPNGFYTDDLDRIMRIIEQKKAGWHYQNGIIEKLMIRDTETGKYLYTVCNDRTA